jgi:hypothetical protein
MDILERLTELREEFVPVKAPILVLENRTPRGAHTGSREQEKNGLEGASGFFRRQWLFSRIADQGSDLARWPASCEVAG